MRYILEHEYKGHCGSIPANTSFEVKWMTESLVITTLGPISYEAFNRAKPAEDSDVFIAGYNYKYGDTLQVKRYCLQGDSDKVKFNLSKLLDKEPKWIRDQKPTLEAVKTQIIKV